MQGQTVTNIKTLHEIYKPIICPDCRKTINRVKLIDGLVKCSKCNKYYHAVMLDNGALTMEESKVTRD